MKLEVGMYVRTADGYIGKLIEKDDDNYCFFDNAIYVNFNERFDNCYFENLEFTKASHNIIDLIEVGDYVNEQMVVKKFYDYVNKEWDIVNSITQHLKFSENRNDIKSIVTKEQFESMKYEVNNETTKI